MSDPITRLNAALEGRPVKSFIHRRSLWRVVGTIAVVGLSYGCGKDGSGGDATGPDPEPQNTIPIASAGADQNVSATLRVELDGSGSSDQDASSLTFRWSLTVKSRFVCKSGGSSSPSARLLGRPPVSGGVRGRGNAGRPRRVWS